MVLQTKNLPTIDFSLKESSSDGIEIIDIESIAKRKSLDHDPTKPHRVNFYCLLYIKEGEGSHFIDFNHYSFSNGSCIFINANQIHAFDFSQPLNAKGVFYNQSFVDKISTKLEIPLFSLDYLFNHKSPVFTINADLRNTIEPLFNELEKETHHALHDSYISELLFSTILLKLIRERPLSRDQSLSIRQMNNITQYLKLIGAHFTESRDAIFYAEKLGMSYKSLNQLCKKACNQTAKQLIDTHTILEAKRQLVVDKSQVTEIAFALGFDEVTNFIKYFKKHTFLTPSQFKANHQ